MKAFLTAFLVLFALVTPAKTITVSKNSRVASLKAALELAVKGDTIRVKGGHYTSLNTIVDKEVVILGENYPVLDAHLKEEVITILANHVTFDGFEIRNSKTGSMRDYAGIRLYRVENATISNNRLVNNFFGIYLSDSRNIRVTGNKTTGNKSPVNSGNGIHLWKCQNISIKNNYITGHRDGIYFEFVKKSFIESNLSEKNLRYGLHFMFSDDDLYHRNTFKSNGSGVAVMYSKRITMVNNLFLENWGSSIYGLLLKDITNSRIEKNRFIRNTTGIYMEGCEGIRATSNNFNNNGWALRLLANCVNISFSKNNFTANSFDVTTNGSLNLNDFTNNYWDKYEGYDLNKDGIGDIPYRPISLYAQIIEQIPQSVMLMRSFIVNLLDKVERAIPSLTPESVKDNNPSMKVWRR
jgi:nitrous oxidase accessory protein